MKKQTLTDSKLDSLGTTFPKSHVKAGKKLAKGERYEIMDTQAPGLGIRVSDGGARTWILKTRFPGHNGPTRRALGVYPGMLPVDARAKAGAWRALIGQGIDPANVEEQARQAALRAQRNTFASVLEDFIAAKVAKERKAREVKRMIERSFIDAAIGKRPIAEITAAEIATVISEKAHKSPSQARNLLGIAKRAFAWARDTHRYGLVTSPCSDLKPAVLVGEEKRARQHTLSDDEMFAFWRAAKRLPYPYGPIYRLLALTGLRLNEVADASWSEFHPEVVRALRNEKDAATVPDDRRTWTIPATRMKGKDSRSRAHVVPITPKMWEILAELPVFKSGDFLFSTTFGKTPVWVSNKVKKRLDARMLRALRALARKRGDDPARVKLAPWKNHDLRRVVRSGLSRIKGIEEVVREAVLAHARQGIEKHYDVYEYLDEKREALTLWAARLDSIVNPQPPAEPAPPADNVVPLRA